MLVMAGNQNVLPAVAAAPHAVALAIRNVAPSMWADLWPVVRMTEVCKPLWPPWSQVAHPAAEHGGLAPRQGGRAHSGMRRVCFKVSQVWEVQGLPRCWPGARGVPNSIIEGLQCRKPGRKQRRAMHVCSAPHRPDRWLAVQLAIPAAAQQSLRKAAGSHSNSPASHCMPSSSPPL